MALLEWKDTYATGIPAVDYEHRRLIELINELHRDIGRSDRAMSVSAFFGDLYAQISAHFALEEKVMRERGYHAYALHKADHERLLDQIRDIMDEYESGGDPTFSDSLRDQLDTWFLRHFQVMDAPLHAEVGEKDR